MAIKKIIYDNLIDDPCEVIVDYAIKDGQGNVINQTYAKVNDLAQVATSGSYNDLLDAPTIDTAINPTSSGLVPSKAIADYIASRGENLVTNGTCLLGNNYNFDDGHEYLVFDGSDGYYSGGCFKHSGGRTSPSTQEFIPVDPSLNYEFSYFAKSSSATSKIYDYIMMFDIDKQLIGANHVTWTKNGSKSSTTTLAQDLKNGDTIVYLTSAENFNTSVSYGYQKGLIFWNYQNSFGYTYGTETYSRNSYADLWEDNNAVNKTNNTITLKAAWNNGTIPAGTAVSQCNSGGYNYFNTSAAGTTEWYKVTNMISGVGKQNATGKFREGTAFIKLGWIIDQNSEANVTWKLSTVSFCRYIPNDTNTWRKVQLNGVDKLGTAINSNPLNLKAGSNISITESGGTFTFTANVPDTTNMISTTSTLTSDKIILGAGNKTAKISDYSVNDIVNIAQGANKAYVIASDGCITGTKDSNDQYTNVSAILTEIGGSDSLNLSEIKIGDNIYVKALNVPDYWVSGKSGSGDNLRLSLDKMETKIPTIPAVGTLITNSADSLTPSAGESFSSSINLHKISKTGSYNDLLNKPTIPTIGILNTNHTESLAVSSSESFTDSINLHKISKTGSYNDLLDKPFIPDTPNDIGAAADSHTHDMSDITDLPIIATKYSDLTADINYVKVRPINAIYNNNADWNLYLSGSFSSTSYVRITMPDTSLNKWTMLYFEISIMQQYNQGACGKVYLFAMHNATTGNWSYLKGTIAGNLSTTLKYYASDRKYLYLSGIYGYGSVSIDKVMAGDAVHDSDLSGIALDTVTSLPETYQTGTLYGAGAQLTWDSNGLRIKDSREDILTTITNSTIKTQLGIPSVGIQPLFSDGSATIATVSNDIVTLKGGLTQTNGAIGNTSDTITLTKIAKTGELADLTQNTNEEVIFDGGNSGIT